MKVLAIQAHGDRSERHVWRRMVEEGVELRMVCSPGAAANDELKSLGARVWTHEFRARFDRTGYALLRNVLLTEQPDIVHAYTSRGLTNAILALRGLNAGLVTYRGTVGHLRLWNPAAWMAHLNPRIDAIICVSEAVRQYLLAKRVPAQRTVTIHKGHDPAWYAGLPAVPREDLGIPANACLVVFTGNMRPVKGVDDLLEALRRLPPTSDVCCLLVGEVRDRRVRALAQKPGIREHVRLVGFRPDAAAIAGSADIFVMPSKRREGLPRAVIEAMAQGVPPIVTAVGGMPELVVDGESGRIVPPGDPAALAVRLGELAADPAERRRLGEGARRRIADAFDVEITLRKTLEVYARVMDARKHPRRGQ